jgi:hypothetical protein
MDSPTPQSKGGKARAISLAPNERKEIAQNAARARWEKMRQRLLDPAGLPRASHQGLLKLGDVEVEVYRLFDGRRLISKRAMAKALSLKSEGGGAFLRTVKSRGVASAIDEKLRKKINTPIVFRHLGKDSSYADGYDAITLIEVCDALIQARNDDTLAPSQHFLAIQSEIILRSCAKLGIVALVDEAVGYSHEKNKDEYRKLFDDFIRDEFRQWEKECPDKLFDMIYRLYGLKRKDPKSFKHPGFFAYFIRKYIYHPLANSNGAILEMLEEKNPVVYAGGGRKFKFHQFLTQEVGLPAFRQHLWQVIGIGASCTDKTGFERAFYRAFPEALPRRNPAQLDLPDILTESA